MDNNKRIAKNTLALYTRTFVMMIVSLYTGRVMLHALGEENYGINGVVGTIVSMSTLITATMSQAISRYITYALGQGDKDRLKILFSTSINAQIVMALVVSVVLEIAGIWFLNNKANIPMGRLDAANQVLHCGIVTLAITLVSSPFNALIIAYERMMVFAYLSILDVTMKLIICFLIQAYEGDRLILFAFLQIGVALIMNTLYAWYCHRSFPVARYCMYVFDRKLMKELTVFSGWNLMNNGAYVFATQGVVMLMNVFFGVVFNAAHLIATQVNNAVQSFVNNFTTAFSPQITKSYADGNRDYAVFLVNRSTKFTWLMMYMFIVPVFMESEMLLNLWLGKVPEMAPLFLRFAMFVSLAVMSGTSLFKLIQADGRIKRYTLHATITAGLIFPLTWVAYRLGAPVWTTYVIFIADFFVINIVRIADIKRLMPFSARRFFTDAVMPCLIVSTVSFIPSTIIVCFMKQDIGRFFLNVTVSILWTGLCCVVFGLTKGERAFFWEKSCQVFNKIIRRKR